MAAVIEGNADALPAPSQIMEGEEWISSTFRAARGWREGEQLERSGKWLIFPIGGDQKLDEQWEIVRAATEADLLGYHAIASTSYHIKKGKWEDGVIMVFTYDYTDREDVDRVRDALRELGFTKILNYKTDEDTAAGISRANGHEGIALYQD